MGFNREFLGLWVENGWFLWFVDVCLSGFFNEFVTRLKESAREHNIFIGHKKTRVGHRQYKGILEADGVHWGILSDPRLVCVGSLV